VTGLLGSLTTFSTFGFETFELVRQGKMGWAAGNVVLNLAVGLAGVWVGWTIVARVAGP
jgi:CrcB protein